MRITRSMILALVTCVLLAAGLRLAHLNSLPIFADESIYVRWAQVMKAEATLRFLPLSDGKQPLYMWVVMPFLKVISDPLLAGRLVSALSGVVTVVGIGVATHILFKNWRTTVFATLIASCLPYLIFFDRMALADSMLVMWLVWAFNFSLLSLTLARWDLSMIAGFCLGFAWLTKSPAIFAVLLMPLGLMLVKPRLKHLFFLATTYVIGFGMYNILRLGAEFHMIAIRTKDYMFPLQEVLLHPFNPLLPHLADSTKFYMYLATPIVVALALWGLVSKSHIKEKLILVAWWLVPIVAQSAIAKQYTARYILFTVPFVIILAAIGLDRLGQKTKVHFLAYAGLAVVLIACIGLDLTLIYKPESLPMPRIERSGYLEEWTAGYGLKDVAEQVKVFAKDGPVIVGSEGYFGTPFDALQLYLNGVPNVRVVGVGGGITTIDPKLTSALADNDVYLVVNSSRLLVADWHDLPVDLIAEYPKAQNPEGLRERLYFFRVRSK